MEVAIKPLKPCNKIGCNILTRERYCDKHTVLSCEGRKETDRYYNKYKRNKVINSFYQSREWRMLRAEVMRRDKGLCVNCLKQGKYSQAKSVHHIVKVKDDWSRRLDMDNCKALCDRCHNEEDKKKK